MTEGYLRCSKCGGETRPRWEEYAQRFGMYGPEAMMGTLYRVCNECGFRWPVRWPVREPEAREG